MKLPRRRFLHLVAGAAALPALSRILWAQAYPSRPVTIIVPFAAGGATDVAARILGEHIGRTLGQQIIIENVPGAGGTTGSTRAMRANADGYTILMGHMGTHAVSVSLYPNLAYRPDVDFEPIGVVVEFPIVLVARKDFPANDLKIREGECREAEYGTRRRRLECLQLRSIVQFALGREADAGPLHRDRACHKCATKRPGRLHVRWHTGSRPPYSGWHAQGVCTWNGRT